MTTKRDWHHQVEHERSLLSMNLIYLLLFIRLFLLVPPNEVYETGDGKTIRVEYREENGTIFKVFIYFLIVFFPKKTFV